MKVLLVENFPLPLYHRLKTAGFDVEHIIVLGQRGIKDSQLRKRLEEETIVFLTQDTEFEDVAANRGKVIISRIRQNLPIRQRVEIWFAALTEFVSRAYVENLFDLIEDGRIIPWKFYKQQ